MADASTQTTGDKGTQAAAPAGTPTPQAPAPAPEKGAKDGWDRMGVSLDDLPVVGEEGQGDGKGEPENGESTDEGGEPANPENQPPAGSELKTKAGRVFKDPTELLTAYENSSSEGMRLASDIKAAKAVQDSLNAKLQETNAALVELQEYVSTTGTFPGAKTPDEVAADEERYNYYSDKRSWENKRSEFTKRITNAKKEAEDYAKSVRTAIEQTESKMAADPQAFPGFSNTADLRKEILANSPHLDNRPDTPYVAYYIARGLMADREGAEKTRLEKESAAKAAAEAEALSRQAGGRWRCPCRETCAERQNRIGPDRGRL